MAFSFGLLYEINDTTKEGDWMPRVVSIFLLILLLLSCTNAMAQTVHTSPQIAASALVESLLDSLEPINATVIGFERDGVILDKGRRTGLRLGQIFELYAAETGFYLGLVEVSDLRARQAVAAFLEQKEEVSIGDLADEVEGGTVVVYGFLDHRGEETELSRSLQEMVITSLAREIGYNVIERTRLEQQMQELHLGYTGLLDADAAEAGNLLGADYVVLGSIDVRADEVLILARLNETESGLTLASSEVLLSRTLSVEEQLRKKEVKEEEEEDVDIKEETPLEVASRLEVITPRPITLFPGETIPLRVRAIDQEGFIMEADVRWALSAESIDRVSLSSTEGERITLTAREPGEVLIRISAASLVELLEIQVKDPPYLQELTLSPITSSIYLGEEQELLLKGVDQYGEPIPVDAAWQIREGQGDLLQKEGERAIFKAQETGLIIIEAKAQDQRVEGEIEVLFPPWELKSLEILPEGPIEIEKGESITLRALPLNYYDEELDVSLNWSVVQGLGRLSPSTGREVTFTPATTGQVKIRVSSESLEAIVEIPVTYGITGVVTDEKGVGIPHVLISSMDHIEEIETGIDGEWSMDGLVGMVTLIPEKVGYQFSPKQYTLTGPEQVMFEGRYRIFGQILDNTGSGIQGVTLSFLHEDYEESPYSLVTTDEKGEWSKEGLSGEVQVIPSKDGYSFSPEHTQITGPEEIDFLATLQPRWERSSLSITGGASLNLLDSSTYHHLIPQAWDLNIPATWYNAYGLFLRAGVSLGQYISLGGEYGYSIGSIPQEIGDLTLQGVSGLLSFHLHRLFALYAGVGYYMGEVQFSYSYQDDYEGEYVGTWDLHYKGGGVGFQVGADLQVPITSSIGLSLDAAYRVLSMDLGLERSTVSQYENTRKDQDLGGFTIQGGLSIYF